MVIRDALQYAIEELGDNKDFSLNESRLILSFLLNKDLSFIHIHTDYDLDESTRKEFKEIIAKRKNNIPLQYIFKKAYFYGRDFYVDERVLIPRFDTEILVEKTINLAKNLDNPSILEIGTGSGIISISLSKEVENAKITAVDISSPALEVAKFNASNLQATSIDFMHSDLFENVGGKYDIIVSNPPYIDKIHMDKLQKEVKYEPELALYGGLDGLKFYEKIIKRAKNYLKDNSFILFEIGYDQFEDVKKLLEVSGYQDIDYYLDIQGYKRVIQAKL